MLPACCTGQAWISNYLKHATVWAGAAAAAGESMLAALSAYTASACCSSALPLATTPLGPLKSPLKTRNVPAGAAARTASSMPPHRLNASAGCPANATRSFSFGLALFLLVTPDPAADFFLANDGYEVDQGLLAPHPAYALRYGAPRGGFSAAGAVLSREFDNATVVVDLAARTAAITVGGVAY